MSERIDLLVQTTRLVCLQIGQRLMPASELPGLIRVTYRVVRDRAKKTNSIWNRAMQRCIDGSMSLPVFYATLHRQVAQQLSLIFL